MRMENSQYLAMQVLNLFELQLTTFFFFFKEGNTSQFYSFLENVFLLISEVLGYCSNVGPMNT